MKILGPKIEEKFYIVWDKTGKLKRFVDISKEKYITEEEWISGVSCFVINESNEVLIEKRVSKGLTPGKLDLCSGHIDNFETPTQSMIRELQEELGINWQESSHNLKKISEKEPAPLVFESNGKKRNFFIYFFCLNIKKAKFKDNQFLKDEIDSIMWIPMDKCFELIQSGKTKFPKDYNYEEIFKKIKEIQQGKIIDKKIEPK